MDIVKLLPTTITQDPFKEPLKGLFLDGVLITGEVRTAHFRPEVDNECQVTLIHPLLVQKYNLHMCHLSMPIEMTNANGSPNKQNVATHVAQIHLCFPKYNHKEYLEVLVLGIDWLNFHNPEVDWSMPSLQFMHCPKHCSKNASQFTIRWTTKAKKQSIAPPKPNIDENGLSKGIKPDYIKTFQHLSEKKNFDKLPIHCEWDHEINLTDNVPLLILAKTYQMTPVEQEALNQFVADELKAGKICELKSPYASPWFFIAKKDGSCHFVQDYQKVNVFTVKDKTPLPHIDDLLNILEDGKLFTKMDIIWGYNNVCIKEGHEWKATFLTLKGLFEPTVMCFGLCNLPGTFMHMMQTLLWFINTNVPSIWMTLF